MTTRLERQNPDEPGLFPRLMGQGWADLPEVVRQAHQGAAPVTLSGRARARGAAGPAALMRRMQGMPPPGLHATTVTIAPGKGGELWTRRFGARPFASFIAPTRGDPWTFEETVAPLTFRFTATPYPGGFSWKMDGWRIGPVRMPLAWGPRVRARSFARPDETGKPVYRFRVLVAHPLMGVVFGYAGRLTSDAG